MFSKPLRIKTHNPLNKMVRSIKTQNSGIFKNYAPKTKIKKCKDCGKEFEQKGGARYERKYCEKCSKKRKADYESLWKVTADNCDE